MSLYISQTFRQRIWPQGESDLPIGKVPVGDAFGARQISSQLGLSAGSGDAEAAGPTAGELAALALLDDSYQKILDHHLSHRDATLLDRVLAVLRAEIGLEVLDRLLVEFAEEFLGARMAGLALLVEGPGRTASEGLERPQILQQILVFWLLQNNRAARPIVSHTHATPLLEIPAFRTVVDLMIGVMNREPGYVVENASLWQLLIRPQLLSPDSLSGQLSRLREIWGDPLGDLLGRMDTFLGMLAEEHAPRFPPGPGPSEVPRYQATEEEIRFSADQSWMSSLVMVAKHTLVWLHQLSNRYERDIRRLDQIPDAELERLAALGFNGLWLIGLWERSPVSQRIKELCGNPEAAASAYSLVRYEVAMELGGEEALAELRRRAARCGIRLAADMVPNHTGLDSDWMANHPDWFMGLDRSPFPVYSFNGQDLSSRPEIGLYLEDHYFDRSDAAVVFKRVDRRSGEVRFIYHGNDGTSMPWNDTAQLNYLNPEVWPAVIDTIVRVAQRFPVIRFDAAMTLTRRHFHRLWYPAPGSAGDIPSRAEHGISNENFREAMPAEFWREVVDRIAEEAPDTLLLAEAFWLMEGFFVRTLGMHRVYNSAFMNMLRDGETPKFRQLIKETLVFDPGILKRYVNFMSNPDELSAIEQFGDGDRYFGTCVLLSTLPGLPMFGHGQVEGFSEQYGMEYRRAYRDEWPREDLEERHRRQVAPLLHGRKRFADVESFRLYDLVSFDGAVHDHVLAYSNGDGAQKTLIVFNNSQHPAHGRLQAAAPFLPVSESGESEPVTEDIHSALGIGSVGFRTARDPLSGREFLFDTAELIEHGLEIELGGWGCRVLEDFVPIELPFEIAHQMKERLGPNGAASLVSLRQDLELEPLRQAVTRAMDRDLLQRLLDLPRGLLELGKHERLLDDLRSFIAELTQSVGLGSAESPDRVRTLTTLAGLARRLLAFDDRSHHRAGTGLQEAMSRQPEISPILYGWILLSIAQDAASLSAAAAPAPDWRLEGSVLHELVQAGGDIEVSRRLLSVLQQALKAGWGQEERQAPTALELQRQLLADKETRTVLGVNQYEGHEYISREALEALVDLRLLLEAQAWSAGTHSKADVADAAHDWWNVLDRLAADAAAAAYRTDQMGIVEVAVTPVDDD